MTDIEGFLTIYGHSDNLLNNNNQYMWLRTNYRAPYFLYDGNIGKMALYFPTDVSILSLSAKLSRIVFSLKPICSFLFSQIF